VECPSDDSDEEYAFGGVGCFCDTEGEPIGCKELGNSSIVSGGEDGEPSVSELPSDECIEPCFFDEVILCPKAHNDKC
jgi:hypothetical protein